MKYVFTFLMTLSLLPTSYAKEGMWLPFLLDQVNEKNMKKSGMKISAADIYDVNEGSLKDAVVLFGGGCTGELISDKGLLITNHHCGYSAAQAQSSTEHNYLLNGFWAGNRQEELPCPGVTVTFIIKVDDVTNEVLTNTNDQMNDSARNAIISKNITQIEKSKKEESGYETLIKSFYYENKYYLFYSEKFTDIRLVGFPPNGIGKFGGDTDNWAWPRHTGDFALFRIYANSANKPAAYNKENIPFKPRRFFKLNISGIDEGDFTWVYGFPGKTTEYLTSSGVREIMETLDPARIALRETRLDIMNADMKKDERTFIQYAAKQAGIANYYKKWKGELMGLKKNKAIEKKQQEEEAFTKWIEEEDGRKEKYDGLLSDIEKIYSNEKDLIEKNEYLNEAIWASDVLKKTSLLLNIYKACDSVREPSQLGSFVTELDQFYKSMNKATDRKISESLFEMYRSKFSTRDDVSLKKMMEALYEESLMADAEHLKTLTKLATTSEVKNAILTDPAYKLFYYFDSVQKQNLKVLKPKQMELTRLYKKYIQALMEYHAGQPFYPDANSTLRVTYGQVEGIKPQDGMVYTWQTTLDGAIAKNNPQVEEFHVPNKLLALHEAQDYGEYAITDEEGHKTVPLAFLASNHTTGGNSGSPVINAKGELIGTNFDRIWEGTMSDIMYDYQLCRNVSLDIRYTLFIIEKFGGAKWLIDEMEIVR